MCLDERSQKTYFLLENTVTRASQAIFSLTTFPSESHFDGHPKYTCKKIKILKALIQFHFLPLKNEAFPALVECCFPGS